jgi:hypothetical protein
MKYRWSHTAFGRMPADHGDRDFAMKLYFEAASRPRGLTDPLREGPWTETILTALLQDNNNFSTSRPIVIEFFRRTGSMYGTASALLRHLVGSLTHIEPLDYKLLAELLALSARQLTHLTTHIDGIKNNTAVLAKCLAAGRQLLPTDPY